ncbi:MAG: outer membrane lipoprotein chaperone LolA [Terriglobia bacterium]
MERNRANDCRDARQRRPETGRAALCVATLAAIVVSVSLALAANASVPIATYVREFESRYADVRTLQADFTQTDNSWGRVREGSGAVYLARGGRMRWVYEKPEKKLFISDGKKVFFYVPAEKQLTVSPAHPGEAQIPLDLLLSHLRLSKIFSRVEFADQALEAAHGDRVIRGYPRFAYKRDIRSVLIELTPSFDVRRLVVFSTDNSTMQFAFSHIELNKPLGAALFLFSPPPGTEVINE